MEGGEVEEVGGAVGGVPAQAPAVRGAAHGAPVQTQGATQSRIGAAVGGQTAIRSRTLGVTLEERGQAQGALWVAAALSSPPGQIQGSEATRALLWVVEVLSIQRQMLEAAEALMDQIPMAVAHTAGMAGPVHMVALDTTTDPLVMEPTMAPTLEVVWAGTLEPEVVTARRLLGWVLGPDSLEGQLSGLRAQLLCMASTTGEHFHF